MPEVRCVVSWPRGREQFIVHVAAPAAEDGTQRCSRCGRVLHDNRSGAPAPWSPGQRVAVSGSGAVRMTVNAAVQWPECEQSDDLPVSAVA